MLTVAEILMRLVCESLRWLATIKSVTCVVLNRSPANLCDAVAVTGELAIRFVGDAGRVISYLIDPISSLALRHTAKVMPRPFRVAGLPVIAALAFTFATELLYWA